MFSFLNKKEIKPKPLPASNRPLTSLEDKQQVLKHLLENLLEGDGTGILIAGSAGTGKSMCVKDVLSSQGIDPVLINSHCTPKSLFETLRDNPTSVIWLDDCEAVLSSLPGIGILRSALFADGARMVTYLSTTGDGPQKFEFRGKVIICCNSVPRSGPFAAVVSRIDTYSLNAERHELIDLMRNMADRGYETLSPNDCHEVIDFIDESTGTKELSMRFYKPSLQKRIFADAKGIEWKVLVKSQLQSIEISNRVTASKLHKADDKELMKQAVEQFESTSEQQKWWSTQTRRSRASFFRMRKLVEDEIGNDYQKEDRDEQ